MAEVVTTPKLQEFDIAKQPSKLEISRALADGLGKDTLDGLSTSWRLGETIDLTPSLDDYIILEGNRIVSPSLFFMIDRMEANTMDGFQDNPVLHTIAQFGKALREFNQAELDAAVLYLIKSDIKPKPRWPVVEEILGKVEKFKRDYPLARSNKLS